LYFDGGGGGDGIALPGRTVGPALLPGSPWTPGLDAPPVPGWFWSDWICAAEGLVNAAAASAPAARLFTMIAFIGHLLHVVSKKTTATHGRSGLIASRALQSSSVRTRTDLQLSGKIRAGLSCLSPKADFGRLIGDVAMRLGSRQVTGAFL
jgi:hypothetical protein